MPLDQWLSAIDLIAREPRRINTVTGVSAWKLKTALRLGSYETAWRMLGRLRRVMAVAVGEDLLTRHVELGLIRLNSNGPNRLRVIGPKGWVVIAVEDRPSYWINRVRMQWAERASPSVRRFVPSVVLPGTHLSSDGSVPNSILNIKGYAQTETLWAPAQRAALDQVRTEYLEALDAEDFDAEPAIPAWPDCATQRVCSIFGSWWRRRHRRRPAKVSLDLELAEFCFYFNRRRWRQRRLFSDLLQRTFAIRSGTI